LVRYLDEIVDPTVAEFERNSTSVRHAFITCVVVFHAVDYRAHPKRSTGLRQEYRTKSDAFALVDMVAHAFKHVRTERRNVPNLRAASVISRPPAVAGVLRTGLSLVGGTTGAVTLANNPSISLLEVVKQAVLFCGSKPGRYPNRIVRPSRAHMAGSQGVA
jgi:hypothetical protein